jgi:outer membrane protein, heavy metal efflux system
MNLDNTRVSRPLRRSTMRDSSHVWTLQVLGIVGVLFVSLTPVMSEDGGRGVSSALPDANARTSPKLDDTASIEDFLAYAALNNAGLRAAFNRWKAALERVPQEGALPDPRFNYAYYIEEVETRVGPQRQKLGLRQTFPWFGKLKLRGGAASDEAAAMQQVYDKVKLGIFYRVKSAYHEYWYLSQAVAVTKEHLNLVRNLEGVARTRFKAGTAPHSSVIQAQVELGKLDDRLRTLEELRKPIVARLNAALNRPTHLPLAWPRSLPRFAVSFTREEAMTWLAESNPDLRRLAHLSEKEEAGIKLAGKSYYPDITFGIDYVDTGDALDSSLADSGKDPVMAMVSVNLPIWHGKYRAAEREAYLKKAAVDKEREDTAKRLAADLELALYHYRDAERKIDLYGDTLVPKGEQSLLVTQQGFEAGKAGFIALIDAQRSLLEFQLAHKRAQADRGTRLAEIEALINRELPVPPSDGGTSSKTTEGGGER